MPSVAQQKADLRAIIYEHIEKHLDESHDLAKIIAMGAVVRLSARMTLAELKDWHLKAILIPAMMAEREE